MECIPCYVRQAAQAIELAVADDAERKRLMRAVLQWLPEIDLDASPPVTAQMIHRRLRGILPAGDPYRAAKDRQNSLAARLIPAIRRRIDGSSDPLIMAVRYAITGNVIDLGAKHNLDAGDIYDELQSAPIQPVFGDTQAFKEAVAKAKNILYLADNAGEIFFDRLLVEKLGTAKITLAVRGRPVINDATREDAQAAGLDELAAVIDNGSDAPGTILADCSAGFRGYFDRADMIIAKGQGNYESLVDENGRIFFLFRTKCSVISRHSGYSIGTYVAARGGTPGKAGAK